MENRIEKAVAYHKAGYNCSQAVVCAYCDLFGISKEVAFKISEGLGGGMGGMHTGTCGAVSGLYLLAGLKNSSGGIENGSTKTSTYQLIRNLTEAFKVKNTSVICADLLGLAGQPKLRSCNGCIEDACRLVEENLIDKEA
ncbi:MAG: C-GCAxxG-C-C family protein [Anaerovorax sp.]